ncbi:HNH endonuclease [Mycobacterium heckeshornense]|uniref:Uncharacterized protein n=1 Tax=Mycobacterium heckeshornense TaxID=110505 RepID=A0A2G8BGE0_9MYCO|nr:HNH endonuclease signature motif containing protein [Mycobacterium heckeshornense]KMV23306.1 hypothetical protein ACT16_06405 [Mycobacterium heckeshornense]MCV7032803.1 HNH endonuclease [Mycobacterium heckeshornense]PIJ36712.1 HNH endonuclease [Mycobacterium heckeshornense]BCO35443.1 hypothetical protein MHEC_18760 [Mycobacterium heckeshornense]
MSSIGLEAIEQRLDALHEAVSGLVGLSFDGLTTRQRFQLLDRLERETRRLPVPRHELVNGIRHEAIPAEIGGKVSHALADRLRISRAEAARWIREAEDLGQRRALTGQPLQPRLAAVAAGQRAGTIGAAHVAVIRTFLHHLPCWVDEPTREQAEAHLAKLAAQFRPEHVAKLADKLADCLNPDGNFSDEDRARRRGLTLGKQDVDGMSPIRGWVTPAVRASLEAVLARWAAPGMCNPHGVGAPVVDGTPSQEAIDSDTRCAGQRNHDALAAVLRAMLASGQLGHHNGLPTSIIVTTTWRELQAACGRGLTGGGSLLPMSEVIRLAQHAHHYLAIFDNGRALALYHTKRIASPAQRIVLYAKDRGCTAPGCDVPGYLTEVHHVTPWATTKTTHIDDLTLACGPNHKLVTPGGWQTRKRAYGRTEWIPPPDLDYGQPRVNMFHHPEELLCDDDP